MELMSKSHQYLDFGTNNNWAAETKSVNIWKDPFRFDIHHEKVINDSLVF